MRDIKKIHDKFRLSELSELIRKKLYAYFEERRKYGWNKREKRW